MSEELTYTAFADRKLLAAGELEPVLRKLKRWQEDGEAKARTKTRTILVFEDRTGRQVDFNLRGSLEQVLERALPHAARLGPGRPRLGVVGREISLLPRHWEWLEEQPNGASAALRRLVDEARKRDEVKTRVRRSLDAAARFMSAMAGDFAGYEEATRALYKKDRERLEELMRKWPKDVRGYVMRLVWDSV